jgi:hypothetical protein
MSAQVHTARHPQRKQTLVIGRVKSRQVVAAVDLRPENVASMRCCQASHIAEI